MVVTEANDGGEWSAFALRRSQAILMFMDLFGFRFLLSLFAKCNWPPPSLTFLKIMHILHKYFIPRLTTRQVKEAAAPRASTNDTHRAPHQPQDERPAPEATKPPQPPPDPAPTPTPIRPSQEALQICLIPLHTPGPIGMGLHEVVA